MLRKNDRNEKIHVFAICASIYQFRTCYVSNLIMFGDFAIEVATFISNQFSKFISKCSPDRHVNVYRTKVILHMHYRVDMSAIVSMDIIDSEIKKISIHIRIPDA